MWLRWCFVFSMCYSFACFSQEQLTFTNPIVTIAIEQTPTSFNPLTDKGEMAPQFKHLLFDPLFRWDKNHHIENRLVKSWKRINDKTIRFYLRKNVRFHSGNLLTSKDVIWSIEEAKKQPSNVFFNSLDKVTIIDRYTFDMTSRLSSIQLFDYLTAIFILDSSFYNKNHTLLTKAPTLISAPVKKLPVSGTGPYIVNQYNPLLGIELVSNPSYWDGYSNIKYFRFMQVNNAQSRLFALLSDDVQISYATPNESIKDVSENGMKRLLQVDSPNAVFLAINDKLTPALKNAKTRKALHLAIDQEGMLKHILNGAGHVNASIISLTEKQLPNQKMDVSVASPSYDLNKSKAMLKTLTLPKQLSLLVMLDEQIDMEKVALTIANMLKRIGIEVTIQKVTSKEVWNKTNLYYDLTLSTWQTTLLSRDNVYDDLFINSFLSDYLRDKSEQGAVTNSFNSKFEYFELLQQEDWIVPLFSQATIWAKSGNFNLKDIFSSNGIPYWSLLKNKPQDKEVLLDQ